MIETKTKVNERRIALSPAMVRALVAGRKTQTRRLVSPQPVGTAINLLEDGWGFDVWTPGETRGPREGRTPDRLHGTIRSPYGQPGDTLAFTEALYKTPSGFARYQSDDALVYRADGEAVIWPWKVSKLVARYCPAWAVRHRATITRVRVERVQDISEADAVAEGLRSFTKDGQVFKFWPVDPFEPCLPKSHPLYVTWSDMPRAAREAYGALWDSINGKGSWASNPWVWAIDFKRI